ncbi:4-amino-4-deoxy-L-arabinose transferase and related glycosyltransferase of PMT family [Niastella koreensis GR20-10]|uniref:4-amino-4-deoxy-L-arabinose transferase and related glycosyltransferase of PMT family n=1 Tax=Niastella koreensis (strain DSM 17620 / KACC 11465 / NBRC 106392 / GR20-10) TaxID=700598 RepID=G8TCJ6_NIAKG|nr:glycosyltransferase family 39 protein [Niastella koreensis]AEW02536.1 4-amino-4-deoxy-L-arabinose transferase and related glycosyltransferase of PMT family [Niastella koreensis GR20-10]
MRSVLQKHHRLLFYVAWVSISVIQAANTELFDDEAYYWVYSRFMDWGYFDHPPMIAALIKAGYAIFHNELGVRFFILLFNTATLFLVQQLTCKKDDRLFYAVVLSIAVAQIGGILAVPDTPLLFFTVLYFWLYQRFLQKTNLTNAMLIGMGMACLLYSKYHGILIIVMVLLSNLKLLSNKYTYVAGAFCLVLFAPHIYWQYKHNFPSIQFHLFERNASGYQFSFTTEYILGQIAFAGPVIGWLLLWAAFMYRPVLAVERAMKYSLIGIYTAFLLSTYKGRVEANWTVAAFIPLMVLSHRYLVQHYQLQKWVYRSVAITLLLVLAGRLYLMSWFPAVLPIKQNEFHGNREWTAGIHLQAGNLPVVFVNTYQRAAKYWFYTGTPAFSLNSPDYRRNNFNLWPIEDSLIGKTVYMDLPGNNEGYRQRFQLHGWRFPQDGVQTNYYSFSRVLFSTIRCTCQQQRSIQINANVTIPQNYQALFQQPVYGATPIWLVLYIDGDVHDFINTGITVKQLIGKRLMHTIPIPPEIIKGAYTARLCIGSVIPGFPTINSTEFELSVQ